MATRTAAAAAASAARPSRCCRAEADDDQHDLGALEEDTLEGDGEADASCA